MLYYPNPTFDLVKSAKLVFHKLLTLLVSLLILLSFVQSESVRADVKLIEFIDYQHDQQLFIDARLQVVLPNALTEAIQHEIPLEFIQTLKLIRHESSFFVPYTRTQSELELHYRLSYSHFYRRYTLENLTHASYQHFSELSAAIHAMSRLDNLPLASLADIHTGLRYSVELEFYLNFWPLPASLLTLSLFNSDWRFSSPTFQMPLQSGLRP
jgi:hypothetical protein